MVSRGFFYSLLLILLWTYGNAVDVRLPPKVTVSFSENEMFESDPINGIISIVHAPDETIDQKSFIYTDTGDPLNVQFVGEKRVADSDIVVSRFSFNLPQKSKGLYLFPSIGVKIGDFTAYSAPTSYEILKSQETEVLKLTSKILDSGPFYPGQKIRAEYKIYFRDPIELTTENLPLLNIPGFHTVGAPKIETYLENDNTVQSITQEITCGTSGVFQISPSIIEGYVYSQTPSGDKIRISGLMRSETPGFSITVQPFPEAAKPASFTGAIGVFDYKDRIISSRSVSVGDKVQVEVVVSGSGDYSTVLFPNLILQPGFKAAFQLSDIPPVGEMISGVKRFVVDLRPLSSDVKVIPAMEFSSFDPISKQYIVKKTSPISITVRPGSEDINLQTTNSNSSMSENSPGSVLPIEIDENLPLTDKNVRAKSVSLLFITYTVFLLIVLLIAQIIAKRAYIMRSQRPIGSRDIFYQALAQKNKPNTCYPLIVKALLLRLYEVGYTNELAKVPEDLKEEGLQGDVRRFLISIEAKRYSGLGQNLDMKEIIDEATQLYHRSGLIAQAKGGR